jgi:hypothetical protein
MIYERHGKTYVYMKPALEPTGVVLQLYKPVGCEDYTCREIAREVKPREFKKVVEKYLSAIKALMMQFIEDAHQEMDRVDVELLTRRGYSSGFYFHANEDVLWNKIESVRDNHFMLPHIQSVLSHDFFNLYRVEFENFSEEQEQFFSDLVRDYIDIQIAHRTSEDSQNEET